VNVANVSTLFIYNNCNSSGTRISKSLEKLSSGLRINRASDDAAGLAISEKMQARINGLDQASENIQDGISLIQTADSALGEIQNSYLQRLSELSVQASNGTLSDFDRQLIENETDQIKDGIEDIAENTNYNGIKLLACAEDTMETVSKSASIDVTTGIVGVCVFNQKVNLSKDVAIGFSRFSLSNDSLVFTFNSTPKKSSYVYSPLGTDTKSTLENLVDTFNKIKNDTSGDPVITAHKNFINDNNMQIRLYGDDVLELSADYDGNITNWWVNGGSDGSTYMPGTEFALGGYGTVIDFTYHEEQAVSQQINLQVGPDKNDVFAVGLSNARNSNTGIDSIDLSSQSSAQQAIATVSSAIDTISAQRSTLGAYQNSLEHIFYNAENSSENLTSAESQIRDLDDAKELMNYAKDSLLQDMSQTFLSQAFQLQRDVVTLLKS